MSTRGNIAIKLRDYDKGVTLFPKKELLPEGVKWPCEKHEPEGVYIPKDAVYMVIYNHHDSYLKGGVGETLLNKYTNYETVLNLILFGDTSGVCEQLAPYAYESHFMEDLHVRFAETSNDTFYEEYGYIFEDGKWFWRKNNTDWSELTEEAIENDY